MISIFFCIFFLFLFHELWLKMIRSFHVLVNNFFLYLNITCEWRMKWIKCDWQTILFTWQMNDYLSWCMKRPTIFMWLRSIKGFRGLSLLMKWEGWIGKIFSVRWAWGKMRSVFYITWPLTLLMHLLAEENKAIHFIQGSAQLPLDHSAFNWFEYYSPWVTLWCGFYRWGRSCAQEIKNVYQTDRKCSF